MTWFNRPEEMLRFERVGRDPGIKPGRAVAFGIENALTGSEEVVLVAEAAVEPALYRDLSRRIKQAAGETLGLSAIRPHPVPLGWIVKTTSGKMSRKENREKYFREGATGLIGGAANACGAGRTRKHRPRRVCRP